MFCFILSVVTNQWLEIIFKMDKQAPASNEKLAKKIKNFIYHPADLIGSGFSSEVFKGVNEL